MRSFSFRWLAWWCGWTAVGASAAPTVALRLIGVQSLPRTELVANSVVGGLSGLDYSATEDAWLAVSDDRSDHGAARAYTLKLDYDTDAFRTVRVSGVTWLRQPDGSTYPDAPAAAARGGEILDAEALRFDPADGTIWYTSEGDRPRAMMPFVRHARRDGVFLGDLPLAPRFQFSLTTESGPRPNLVFEGLSFAPDGRSLWVALEGPLFQDGPVPTATAGALIRLMHVQRDGRQLGEFAYPVEPIPPVPAGARFPSNGVSEVLTLTPERLLVLERSGRQDEAGNWHYVIRLFEADTSAATEISALPALVGAKVVPASKDLVFAFAAAGVPDVQNLEGLAWGRVLPNGHRTLVVMADDNFQAAESTQVWVFEVLPAAPFTP